MGLWSWLVTIAETDLIFRGHFPEQNPVLLFLYDGVLDKMEFPSKKLYRKSHIKSDLLTTCSPFQTQICSCLCICKPYVTVHIYLSILTTEIKAYSRPSWHQTSSVSYATSNINSESCSNISTKHLAIKWKG